jgi:hypothetical protein
VFQDMGSSAGAGIQSAASCSSLLRDVEGDALSNLIINRLSRRPECGLP